MATMGATAATGSKSASTWGPGSPGPSASLQTSAEMMAHERGSTEAAGFAQARGVPRPRSERRLTDSGEGYYNDANMLTTLSLSAARVRHLLTRCFVG